MMKAVLLVFTILIGISLLVEGDDKCLIRGKAKMKAYGTSRYNMNLKMPCKFQATTQICDGYKIQVSPGLAFDFKARYFTDTVFIGIIKHKTEFYWRGRTSSKRLTKYFNGTVDEPFNTNEENRNFDLGITTNAKDMSVTMQVGKAKIVYTAYDEKVKSQRKKNGLEITCAGDAEYKKGKGFYPAAICGNKSDVMTARRKELGFSSRKHTVMYDILNNPTVYQTNPQCESAINVFRACSSEDRVAAMEECSDSVAKASAIKCQNKHGYDPMETFLFCLKHKCNKNDYDSCGYLKEREAVCSNIGVLKGASCPKMGPGDDSD